MSKKTALITGASRGIGRAASLELAKNSYDLILTCKANSTLLLEVKKEAEQFGSNCSTFVGDLSDYKVVTDLFQYINNLHIASLDLLINNMGISYIGLLQDMTIVEWDNVINTNLSSAFSMCKHVIPYMLKQGHGKIINISSIWGNDGASCEVAYSASKGGMNAFTKSLAKELAPSNIQVNAVACGAIDTEMNNFLSEIDKKSMIDGIPSGRLGTPEEAGRFICQIGYAPDYLTGQVIDFDGGGL